MKKNSQQRMLIAEAKASLDNIARIVFASRKATISVDIIVRTWRTKVVGTIKLICLSGPFDEVDLDIAVTKMVGDGRWTNIHVCRRGKHNEIIQLSATFAPNGTVADESSYCEITIGDLLRYIKRHPLQFPAGNETKITLGDFEGSTYHRNVVLGMDRGRLMIGYELNECDR